MEKVPETDIKRYLGLIVKRRYLFAAAAIVLISAIVAASYLIPPVYEAKTTVSVEKSFLNGIMKDLSVAATGDDKVNALATIMKSRTLIYKVIKDLDLELSKKSESEVEGLILIFQNKTDIKIEFNKSSKRNIDFFTVSFRHKDPRIARDFVNTLIGRYIEENLGAKRESSVGANRFLLDQINQNKDKVDRLEAEIASLTKNPKVIVYDRLLELNRRYHELLVQYTEDHPEVRKVKAEIEALKPAAVNTRAASAGTEGPGSGVVDASSGASVKNRLSALERERDTYKKILAELIAAYGKSEVTTQAELQDKTGTFRIVDPAVLPLTPVSPNRVQIMLLGIVGGIGMAFGLLILLDMTDKSVKSIEVIRSMGVPLLAVIPHIHDPRQAVMIRKRDALLYSCTGLFVVMLAAVIIREMLS